MANYKKYDIQYTLMKKLILSLLVIILFINFTSASLGTFEQRQCVDIKTILNTTSVNISTISYPNLSTAVSNQQMTLLGSQTFNFSFCDTATIGTYIYDYIDGEDNVFVNDFVITKNGFDITTGESLLYMGLLFANLIVFSLFLFVAITTPFDNVTELQGSSTMVVLKVTKSKYMKIIASWLSYGAFLWFITLLTGITQNYINFVELKILMTNLYTFFYFLGFGVTAGMLWLVFYWTWKDILFNKEIIKSGKAVMRKL